MEQERKIEKWLKAYSKKRRGQASDQFKLDPATRQILQNEISRSAPASEGDDETMSLWELLRKHWLYLLGFAACIFVLAALFLPIKLAPQRAYLGRSTQSITDNMRQIPASTRGQIESGTGSLAPPAVTSENSLAHAPPVQPESNELATATAGIPAGQHGFNGPATESETVASASMAPVLRMSDAARETEKTLSEPPALSPPAGIAPNVAGGNYAVNSMPGNSGQMFGPRREPSEGFGGGGGMLNGRIARNDYLETIASPSQSAAVLMNFHVSQNGNTIRVVDQDGSVYTGSLEPEGGQNATVAGTAALDNPAMLNTAALNSITQKSESPKMTQFDTIGGNANNRNNASPSPESTPSGLSQAAKEPSAAAGLQAPMQKYFFYVQGTNQTLKQSVVFAGTLLEDLSFVSNAQQTFGMNANAAIGAAYAQQFMRSLMTNQPIRIDGVAIIDKTYKIQINATSVPAKSTAPSK